MQTFWGQLRVIGDELIFAGSHAVCLWNSYLVKSREMKFNILTEVMILLSQMVSGGSS